MSWGFYYPIYLKTLGKVLQVGVGTKSRYRQDQDWNPIANAKHKAMVAAIRAALT